MLLLGKCPFIKELLTQKYGKIAPLKSHTQLSFKNLACATVIAIDASADMVQTLKAYKNICNTVFVCAKDSDWHEIKHIKRPFYHANLFELIENKAALLKIADDIVLNESMQLLIQDTNHGIIETELTTAETSVVRHLAAGAATKAELLNSALGYSKDAQTYALEAHLLRLKTKLRGTPILTQHPTLFKVQSV